MTTSVLQRVTADIPCTLRLDFDYNALDNDLAIGMQAAAKKIREYMRASVIDVGRELNEVKPRIEHGCFVAWVEAECEISIRSAQRAMLAAHVVDENDKLSYLPVEALAALGGKSAPRSVKAQILKEIEDGRRPIGAEIKQRLAAGRQGNRAKARKPDPLASILGACSRLSLIDQQRLIRDLWNKSPPAERAAFRDWAFPGFRTGSLCDGTTPPSAEVSSSIGPAGSGKSGVATASAEPADSNTGPTPTEAGPSDAGSACGSASNGPEIDAPATADVTPPAAINTAPLSDAVTAAASTAEEMSRDRLETEFAALSAEQRAIDREWVMRRLPQRDRPSGDQTSRFLQLYIAAPPAERAAFLARRVAEPVPKAA